MKLSAGNLETTLSGSTTWDSNVQSISLIKKLNTETVDKVSSMFLITDAQLRLDPEEKSIGFSYAASGAHALSDISFSHFEQSGTVFRNVEISETSQITISGEIDHYLENFKTPLTYFDGSVSADFFMDFSEKTAFFANLKAGYYKNITDHIDDIKYLNGPAAGISGGAYLYPLENQTHIKLNTGSRFYYFRDWIIKAEKNGKPEHLGVCNKYFRTFAQIESSVPFQKFTVSVSALYAWLIWLKIDNWSDGWEKRRIEHEAGFTLSSGYLFSDSLSAFFRYSYFRNFSNISSIKTDYYDYNYDRHEISLTMSLNF